MSTNPTSPPPPVCYPGYGRPVRHKRRRKLTNGYRYNSLNQLVSPNGHLVFKRWDSHGVCYIEGDMVRLWDSLEGLRRLAKELVRNQKRRKRPSVIGVGKAGP
jgi:hypothetical protein